MCPWQVALEEAERQLTSGLPTVDKGSLCVRKSVISWRLSDRWGLAGGVVGRMVEAGRLAG